MKPLKITAFHTAQAPVDAAICDAPMAIIDRYLPQAKVRMWHAHPAWFIAGNTIVGHGTPKSGVRCMFWSSQSFDGRGVDTHGPFQRRLPV